ncbi:MAG TPA: DUF1559 domain-containing protein [Gemmataceae bacterium]|jgi:hypothetical protein|nr:DUF1559 domain-containing protein [Gemmataceae bacterium]
MSRRRLFLVMVVVALVVVCCLVLLPCAQKVRDGESWVGSAVSVKRIAQAFQNYHEVNGRYPPAVVRDKDGRALYSWRVLLLPYLERDQLYREFRLDEPWDSPHNQTLLTRMPSCYTAAFFGTPGAEQGLTHYQVLVGPGTAFEREGLTEADFPDGLANTLFVVEAARPVLWTQPTDLTYDPDSPLPPLGGPFTKPVHFLCHEVWRKPGFNAGFGDGSTRFISSKTDEAVLRALITRNGGERVDLSRLE